MGLYGGGRKTKLSYQAERATLPGQPPSLVLWDASFSQPAWHLVTSQKDQCPPHGRLLLRRCSHLHAHITKLLRCREPGAALEALGIG